MVLRDLFHANILQEVYLKSKSFLWNVEKMSSLFCTERTAVFANEQQERAEQ